MSVSTEAEADRVEQLEQRVDELETENQELRNRVEHIEDQDEQVDELKQELEEKDDRIESQDQRIDELEQENNDLREELQQYREHNERDKAKVKQRVTGVETEIEEIDTGEPDDPDENPRSNVDETRSQTPLDQIVQLPESVAEQELTANQIRARFVTKDVLDYASKVPAGCAVTSSDIRTILAAKDGGTPHTETVSRVMNFLDRFGKDDVEIVKRHGKRRVIFTEEAAKRFHSIEARDQGEVTGVVMGQVTG